MYSPTPQPNSPRLLRAVLVLGVLAATLTPDTAHGWKPSTHIYLAEQALKDALDDGKVTIYRLDAGGGASTKLGDYTVDPNVLAALRSYPKQYRAGVLGPDAFPDIVTGQRVIHPQVSQPSGSNSWLEYLWSSTANDSGAAKAFVVGFLTHASGDMYGHTFVNNFTGGPFVLGDNAIKHIVVEGYVGKRTPDTYDSSGQRVTEDSVSLDGIDDYIYRNMVQATPSGTLAQRLYYGEDGHLTLPIVYSTMRAALQASIDGYYQTKQEYDREYDALIEKADNCGLFDGSCWKTVLYPQAAAVQVEKGAYVATHGPGITYYEFWRDDIDEGLAAWPGVSFELAKELVFNTSGVDGESIKRVQKIVDDYRNEHLLSMSGAPDAVGSSIAVIGDIMDEIDFVKEAVAAMKRDLLNYMLETATGLTIDDIKKYFTSPDKYFDEVMGVGAGEHTALAKFNREVLGISDSGYNNPGERFEYEQVPAAYNTVTINKLILLSKDEINRLLRDLGSPQSLQSANVMLGFIRILDGDNEWRNHGDKLVFANSCDQYSQLFMPQTGEDEKCATASCFDAVQGKIAWDYEGDKQWDTGNIRSLCKGAEASLEPARCFDRVMHSGVDKGDGTEWDWWDAVALCKSTLDADGTIECFESRVEGGMDLQQVIQECGK